ncbi:TIGR03013 family XrtA/PEP-CTERM system glycosyltransferase [Diaphorobacter sp.]|uniref:TIGR03013 family XrtA/PEP-CTERM system glycosyltransferase n=1 Tax=Diaphorobacter sp. TaxID=1934310 RepID=UPI003D14D3BE
MIRIFNHYFHRRHILQIMVYSVVIVSAIFAALALQTEAGSLSASTISSGLVRGLLMAIGILAVNFALGLYGNMGELTLGQMRARAVLSFLFTLIITAGILLLMPLHSPYQNEPVFFALLLTAAGMLIIRFLGGDLLPAAYQRQRLLIYGTGARARIVGQSLAMSGRDTELVGYFAGLQEKERVVPDSSVIASGQSLAELVRQRGINEIVVALDERRRGSMSLRDLLDCKLSGVRVIDIAVYFEQSLGQIHMDAVSAGWLVFGDGFKQGVVRSAVKWLFDVVGASVLLLLASPVMLLTAILIYLESGGPIFYRQERVGRDGRVFNVVKFRSMRNDAEKDGKPRWATSGDSRITRVGRIIRKMRIDELPQLFCVLKGDMSLVGPRPERPFFVEQLTKDIPYYALRHGIKPGLTGWAQVRYHYGASIEDAAQKLQYDLYYVKNHSWFLDLIILFETVGVVLTGKGAQ